MQRLSKNLPYCLIKLDFTAMTIGNESLLANLCRKKHGHKAGYHKYIYKNINRYIYATMYNG